MQDQTQSGLHREHLLLDRIASETLDPNAYARWAAVRSSHRFMVHKGKRIIAFRLSGTTPVTLNTFECVSVSAAFDRGFTSTWLMRGAPSGNTTIALGHAPVEVADGCFMGHTMSTGTEYVEYKDQKLGLLVSMYYKTPSNPQRALHQGPVYLIEEPAFHRIFS